MPVAIERARQSNHGVTMEIPAPTGLQGLKGSLAHSTILLTTEFGCTPAQDPPVVSALMESVVVVVVVPRARKEPPRTLAALGVLAVMADVVVKVVQAAHTETRVLDSLHRATTPSE